MKFGNMPDSVQEVGKQNPEAGAILALSSAQERTVPFRGVDGKEYRRSLGEAYLQVFAILKEIANDSSSPETERAVLAAFLKIYNDVQQLEDNMTSPTSQQLLVELVANIKDFSKKFERYGAFRGGLDGRLAKIDQQLDEHPTNENHKLKGYLGFDQDDRWNGQYRKKHLLSAFQGTLDDLVRHLGIATSVIRENSAFDSNSMNDVSGKHGRPLSNFVERTEHWGVVSTNSDRKVLEKADVVRRLA